jgi:DNA replication protein DnaD
MAMGWVKLHREIMGHWLYNEPRVFSRFEAWIYLILKANHRDNAFIMNGSIVKVKRGEMITSVKSLAVQWMWSRTKVKKFLDVLESDGMLTYICDNKKTRISLRNYCLYQDSGDGEKISDEKQENTRRTSERHQKCTNNNDKECNKNEKNIKSISA